MQKGFIMLILLFITTASNSGWGFFAHKEINRLAVFTLPPPLERFYKKHIDFVVENAINPDQRRYVVKEEAPRHYIDLDVYGDSALYVLPKNWKEAVAKYTEDTLKEYGIVPWRIMAVKNQLTAAFYKKDLESILNLSADLGHYIGDANVPLHTTSNYNGQFTGQKGIHGFWESRLPELFFDEYEFWIGKATYEPDPQSRAWKAVAVANAALDSVFNFEKKLSMKFSDDKKYTIESTGKSTKKVYSREFALAYHKLLSGMVERQMKRSVKMVGDFWFTCWVDAGKPDLEDIGDLPDSLENKSTGIVKDSIKVRPHDNR